MASFSAGTTFTDGVANDVTAAKLAALVNAATPTSGLIQDRTAETTIASGDTLLIGDASDSNNLKRMTVANFAGTLPTATITSGTITTLNSTTGTITTGVIPTLTSTTLITTGTGTAASPAIVPTGDSNTGVFFPAADTIAFSEGGTEAMRINSSGQVGIGTTSADSIFHIKDSVAVLTIEGTATSSASVQFKTNTINRYKIATPDSSADLAFYSSGTTERLRIDSSGNVGIGTASPTAQVTIGKVVNSATLPSTSANHSISLYPPTTPGYYGGGISWSEGTNTAANICAVDDGASGALGLVLSTGNNSAIAERLRIDSSGNVIISGNKSLVSNGAGGISSNTSIGSSALSSNTTGSFNTASGVNALLLNTTGANNTASGVTALASNTTGSLNTASGLNALYSNTTGGNNTASGVNALYSNTTGIFNTASGYAAGYGTGTHANTTGANNTFIGFNAEGASGTASNVITLGNGSIATLRCQVTSITSLSDKRDKKDIENLSAGLDFVGKLRPVSFVWNTRDKAKVNIPDAGFIAQELLEVQEVTGITIPNLVSQENPEKLEAAYGTLIPVLVQAIKELKAKVESLEEKNK